MSRRASVSPRLSGPSTWLAAVACGIIGTDVTSTPRGFLTTRPPARFRHGDHVCAVYDTPEEQVRVAAHFIADGLRSGERCLFAGYSAQALIDFCERLKAEGIDAHHERDRGALLLLTKEQAHLIDGVFDSERMLTMLNNAAEQALNDGYAGLRTCGDMTWLLDDAPGSTQVAEYEALVTELFKSVRALAMCQYDRARLPPGVLTNAFATHPTLVIAGQHVRNEHFTTPFMPR